MNKERYIYPVNEYIKENVLKNFVGGESCVYVVWCKDPATNLPVPVNTVGGLNKDGILYIGKSDNALSRPLNANWTFIDPTRNGASHGSGHRYNANPLLKKLFPLENLCLELFKTDNARELEVELLNNYDMTFGMLPPLNRSM